MNAAVAEKKPTSTATAERGLLRFITAGSVDDGKSTLIGRLLINWMQCRAPSTSVLWVMQSTCRC